jgi:hypothetical protein
VAKKATLKFMPEQVIEKLDHAVDANKFRVA